MKVAVFGHTGRLGSVIADAVSAADDLELEALVSSESGTGETPAIDVAIDVTTAEAARINLPMLAEAGIDVVVGTTGFTSEDEEQFHKLFSANDGRCFLVPNFSIGAVVLMKLAAQAAPYFDGVEIIELHHEKKVDAPSGTARHTAAAIAAARTTPWTKEGTRNEAVTGVRGGKVDDITVHSVRLPGLVAHEEVIFGTTGQSLTLRHDSYDRSSFADGALLAVRRIASLPTGLSKGLDAVLSF